MTEAHFNPKNIKPTLDPPTKMGKQLDTHFKKEIRKSGMNIKENHLAEDKEKKTSLKKKIFKLDKMETLVHSDEALSRKFEELKGVDPELKWGYHWNEVILNIIFNDHVLNSPKYLQKYKNTRAKQKTRRGEEGIKQLQNDLEKEKAASSQADVKTKELMSGDDSEDKEKVDELFGFGKSTATELPMNQRSKNDTYLVNMRNKKLIAPVPYKSTPEEKQAIISKYLNNPDIKQISWYNAVKQGIQGVPTEVPDGSIQAMDAEVAKRYPQGIENMVSLAEENVSETDGGAAGAYSMGLDAQNGLGNEITDKTYQNETTTSSSSGQYSGKAIWAKSPKSSRWAHKPAWHGGKIVTESVVEGKDYLIESNAFKKYIFKNEIIDMLNECDNMEEAESFKQTHERMLKKLDQFVGENPELAKDPDFQELVQITKERAGQTQGATQPTQPNVSEHHLHSKQDKIDFILQHTYDDATDSATHSADELNAKSDEEIDALYRSTEKNVGMTEQMEDENYKAQMKKDLEYNGKKVDGNESAKELETQDGLFKGRWNNNESIEDDMENQDVEDFETPTEPEEDDCIVSSNGFKLSVSCGGKHIGEFTEDEQAWQAVRDWKKQNNWFPNTWFVSDHGNASLVDDDGNMLNEHKIVNDKNVDKVKDNFKTPLHEKAKSKKQQKFMGMVHAAQKGKLKDPSPAVAKAAASMSDKDAEDFASTKHKGLPEKVKKKKVNEDISDLGNDTYVEYYKDMQGEVPFKIGDQRYEYVWAKYPNGKIDIGVYAPAQDLVYNYNIFRKMHRLDESFRNKMKTKINEMNNIDKDQYKSYLKKRLNESATLYKSLNESEKKAMLEVFHEDFINEKWDKETKVSPNEKGEHSDYTVEELRKQLAAAKKRGDSNEVKELNFAIRAKTGWGKVNESMVDDQPDSMINPQEDSIAKSMDSDELNVDGQPVPNATSPVQEAGYDDDDIKAKAPIGDKLADYSDEEPVSDEPESLDAPAEKEKSEPQYYHSGGEDQQTIDDAAKFREMLKAKYGVDSVSELSPLQRQELMKSMNFGTAAPEKSGIDMDFSQFKASDAEKAEYKARDQKRLDFLAHNANRVNDIKDYLSLASQFKADTGENMFHPMAILSSIEQLPQDSTLRHKLSNIEQVLKSQMNKTMAESLNEERKVSAIINVEKLGAENAKNFKKDSAEEDGLKKEKTSPKPDDNDIRKAAVWPKPQDFYIEQDLDKVQKEAKSMADIEKEVLDKTKGQALDNVGNSTNDKGNEIPKRNLTKEEMYELAMNRGDGMQNIVYDNKPSEKFEKRMEQDMGKDMYKNRQDKMKYKEDMPMYNKDTQPVEKGDEKEQDNKFAKGYNNESVTAKYRDEYGKLKLVEFAMTDVEEVTTISEDAIKLSVEGMGNKYNLQDKKINENVGFDEIVDKFAFYLVENKIVAIEKAKVIVETKIEVKKNVNESFNKMKHLMNYKPSNYVDTKKSVKF